MDVYRDPLLNRLLPGQESTKNGRVESFDTKIEQRVLLKFGRGPILFETHPNLIPDDEPSSETQVTYMIALLILSLSTWSISPGASQ